ncbi:hypothetical protein BKA61DRAFT_590527 [Leptodontidium sp. MPI-SDFR-AT-0119]|nr:hypothetical protein BKA61DRAFT_590527 [Leptodontidium sp. MPI-SDFR-AT-0119]
MSGCLPRVALALAWLGFALQQNHQTRSDVEDHLTVGGQLLPQPQLTIFFLYCITSSNIRASVPRHCRCTPHCLLHVQPTTNAP